MSIRNTSKESIRSRLLKNAAHYWGQDATQSLDPFVKLLMEALSVELYKAYNEIQSTDARILEKITRLLTPELYVSARPAHAIAHLRIHEPGQVLNARNQFYQHLRVATREDGLLDAEYPVVFTPLDTVRLFDGEVKYLIAGNALYTYSEQKNKLFNRTAQSLLPAHKVWIGLDIHPEEDLSRLSFYLQFAIPAEDWAYTLWPLARWSVNGQPLRVQAGPAFTGDAETTVRTEQSVFGDYEMMRMIENDIRVQYHRAFLTIENLETIRQTTDIYAVPESLQQAFPEHTQKESSKPLIWLEVELPPHFTPALLDHVSLLINAFPVINRKLRQLHHTLNELSRIIPVVPAMHEQLLSIASVTDDQGRTYFSRPFEAGEESGYYSVRYGGTERFDERNAQEQLQYLTELLRDEVASFAAYGKDFVRTIANDLSQKIKLISQKTGQDYNRYREQTSYLMVSPLDAQSAGLTVEYWTTNSTLANGLRAGSELLRLQTSLPITTNLILLTDVSNGQERLRATERLNAYKYALTTRNRLVTYEDLKSFCLLQLGSRIRDVAIRRGLTTGQGPKEGLVATTDIVVLVGTTEDVTSAEWQQLCADLKAQIEARAIHGIRYRVWAEQAN